MDILGIGPMELAFIVIIALIVLGPKDMAKSGRTIGKFMRDVVKSDTWKAIKTTTKELEHLPTRMMREAGLDENLRELDNISRSVIAADLSTRSIKPPAIPSENKTAKPASPEDAAFTPDLLPDRIDSTETIDPPTFPTD
jgi:Sec-independent protein translocase protein TatA